MTLRQIRDVKTATQAAEEAIAGLKIRFSHFDVIQETAIAETALTALRKAAAGQDLSQTAETHDRLATSLVNLRERFSISDAAFSAQINDALLSVEALPKLVRA